MHKNNKITDANVPNAKGAFTILELLVVIAIISILSVIIFANFKPTREGSNNSNRISSLKALQTGTELFLVDNGHYPPSCGQGYYNFSYGTINETTGLCTDPAPSLRFENSTSPGFLSELFVRGYITQGNWKDPMDPGDGDPENIFNCRYVVPCNIPDPFPMSTCPCRPTYYLLHCQTEGTSVAAQNDGGGNPQSYELTGGSEKLCVIATPS